MAHYDDLDEMRVVNKHGEEIEDDIQERPKKERVKREKKKDAAKPLPYLARKQAEERAARIKMIVICVAVFAVVMTALIAVGLMMYQRGNPDGYYKATPAEGRTMYRNENNVPEFSADGVKGLLREAYYTKRGDLAVTLNVSNGTDSDHRVNRVSIRIFNEKDETVAEATVERFPSGNLVESNGRKQLYFVIDKQFVALSDDSLGMLGSTMEIASQAVKNKNEADGDGPKDIASGRTYFENLGNLPELSADGVKATVVRARYTVDGSLAVTLSLSNGAEVNKMTSAIDIKIANGVTGETIASQKFTGTEAACRIASMSYSQLDLTIDAANVPIDDDSLESLSCTISVSADTIA